MALSAIEDHLVYEILGVPNAELTPYAQGSKIARDEIAARIAGLAAGPEERLKELIAEWQTVSTSSLTLNSKESNEGASLSHSRQRALIRQRVTEIIPVSFERSRLGERGAIELG